MDHNKIFKEQVLHLVFGSLFFIIILVMAVALDLVSNWIQVFAVSQFTILALSFTAHAMLLLDLVLFFVYLIITSIELVKGMSKP